MTTKSIAERLADDPDRRHLIDLLLRQQLVQGNEIVARTLSDVCEVVDLPAGEIVIRQGDADTEIYFILSGRVRILVNEREVANRGTGQHVGEMALIDASLKRSATVITTEESTFARVSESAFIRMANASPFVWRHIAIELIRRLDERSKFHKSPNASPILFVGSSREGLAIANALARQIPGHIATVKLWSEGVFGASHFPIEDLTTLLQCSDYAVLLATADDTVTCRGVDAPAPRDNIVFELGLFMGAITRHRTFIVVPRGTDIKIPSDLLGINAVFYDASASMPEEAVRLAALEITAIIQSNGPR